MIRTKDLFFDGKIDTSSWSYSQELLYYLCCNYIQTHEKVSVELLFKYVSGLYKNAIKMAKFRDSFIESNFDVNNSGYLILSPNQEQCLEQVYRFERVFLYYRNLSDNELIANVVKKKGIYKENAVEILPYLLGLYYKKDYYPNDYWNAIVFNLVEEYDDKYLMLDKALTLVDESYNPLALSNVIYDEIVLEILDASNYYNFKDLLFGNIHFLLHVFAVNFKQTLSSLSLMQENYYDVLKRETIKRINSLKDREREVFEYRHGFNGKKPLTLEELGDLFGLTRERIRQVETAATRRLQIDSSYRSVLNTLFYDLLKPNDLYVQETTFRNKFGDSTLADYVLFFYTDEKNNVVYDQQYHLLFDKNSVSLSSIVSELEYVCGDILSKSDYEYLNVSEKAIIDSRYRLFKDNLYVKKGIYGGELVANIIDKYFMDGYKPGNSNDYLKLTDSYKKEYGEEMDIPSDRAIAGIIANHEYVLVDKGTYRRKMFCPILPEDLRNRMLMFMGEHQPVVYYKTIYDHFENELQALGVDNHWFMKGLIDEYIVEPMHTKRDYVQTGKEKISSREAMVKFFHSFESKFSFDDIKEGFPGVADYVITFALMDEEKNGLLMLPNKEFVYFENTGISKDTTTELESYMLEQAAKINSRVISSHKVMGRLRIFNKDLLSKLNIIDNQFGLFSLLKYLFRDKYSFRRPLISLDGDSAITSEGVLIDHLNTLDRFNSKTVNDFTAKMNIRGLYSYLMFMESMSSDFVQINKDTMVSKKVFRIQDTDLARIMETINLIFTGTKEIYTETFNGYRILPKLEYPWNKYLLVGIIRSYLSNYYEVENTANTYDETDYIIRRISDGWYYVEI